jgi:hypothetical protein
LAMGAMYLWARSSDTTRERVGHTVIAAVAASGALFVAAITDPGALRLIAISVAVIATQASVVILWTLPQSLLGGTAAAAGLAFVNSIGAVAGFAGPYLVGLLLRRSGDYNAGFAVMGASLLVEAVIIIVVGQLIRGQAFASSAY